MMGGALATMMVTLVNALHWLACVGWVDVEGWFCGSVGEDVGRIGGRRMLRRGGRVVRKDLGMWCGAGARPLAWRRMDS